MKKKQVKETHSEGKTHSGVKANWIKLGMFIEAKYLAQPNCAHCATFLRRLVTYTLNTQSPVIVF